MGYNGKTHIISNLKNVSYVNHTRAVEVRGLPFDAIIENVILSSSGFKTRHTRIHSCVSHDKGMRIYDVVWLRNGRTCKNTIILDLSVLWLLLMLCYVVYHPIWIFTYGDLNIGNEGLKNFGLCYFYRATPTVPDTEPRLTDSSGSLLNSNMHVNTLANIFWTYFYYVQDKIRIRQQALPIWVFSI